MKIWNMLILTILLFALAACTATTAEPALLEQAGDNNSNTVSNNEAGITTQSNEAEHTAQSAEVSDNEKSLMVGGDVEPQLPTPGSGSSDDTSVVSSSGDVVNSSSDIIEGSTGEDTATVIQGNAPSDAPAPEAVTWQTYTHPDLSFTFNYPSAYTLITDGVVTENNGLQSVQLQDSRIAGSDMADRELPQFTVDVIDWDGTTLQDWLTETGRIPANATVEPVTLQNAGDGWKVTLKTMIAPNEFYYVAGDNVVFKLTPLGPYSNDILNSFHFENSR